MASSTRSTPGRWTCSSLGARVGDVEPADPQHRGVQGVEAALLHPGGDLRADPAEALRLLDHHAPAGTPHRRHDRLVVERHDGAQVDHLDVPALVLRRLGRLEGDGHAGAVRHQRDVATRRARTAAVPNGAALTGSSTSALLQYSRLGSMKITGSGSAIASRSSEYASSTVAGVTTFRPGVCA